MKRLIIRVQVNWQLMQAYEAFSCWCLLDAALAEGNTTAAVQTLLRAAHDAATCCLPNNGQGYKEADHTPEKMKEAMGRLGDLRPTRARRMARLMATTASSCPITRLCSVSSILISRALSSLDTYSMNLADVTSLNQFPAGVMWGLAKTTPAGEPLTGTSLLLLQVVLEPVLPAYSTSRP